MLKTHWREFKHGRPGRRFEDRFERKKAARAERSWAARTLKPAAGVVLLVAGIVFCLIPGPGIPLLVIGGGLLADVSRPVARTLDRVEVLAWKLAAWARRKWYQLPPAGKFAAVIFSLCVAGSVALGGFILILG